MRGEAPIVIKHDSIHVVRDDLFPGGTKARYVADLFEDADEVVYASPAEGGAQFALASVAQQLGKQATIFVAARRDPHPRQLEAKRLGAKVVLIEPGYLSVVQARAGAYAAETGARLAPFGMDVPDAARAIAEAARRIDVEPDEVWCAAASGTLARGLALAFPRARRYAVRVGRNFTSDEVSGAEMHRHPLATTPQSLKIPCKTRPPFPSDLHYDAKAWEVCKMNSHRGRVLFWNVCAPAQP